MELHQDFKDLLQAFVQEGVRYVMIGGYAVGLHARPRFTKDIDLGSGSTPITSSAWREHSNGSPPVRVDLLRAVPGGEFEEAYGRRLELRWGSTPISVVSLDDLIELKRAAGRRRDRADLRALERARTRKKR
jgi:hypothetical protein